MHGFYLHLSALLLAVISFFHEGIDLLYTIYQSCKKHICKPSYTTAVKHDTKRETVEFESKEDNDVIDDPWKCCYHCGWNGTTRNETLGAITLWFQDVPMLTLAVLYGLSQSTCKVPDSRDVTPILLDVAISATAATVVSFWRLLRSFVRLYTSVGSRIKDKGKCLKKCVPKKGDAAYPPDTCAQWCIFPFYFGLIMQFSAIVAAASATFSIWYNYSLLQTPNFDDSLGIYRFSLDHPDVRLFNISGTIIPPNGTFINFEEIPQRELPYVGDVYCLSEFEYKSEEFQIFFNTIEVVVVSNDGRFCINRTGPELPNVCILFYTFRNFVLYYASINPITGRTERFSDQCIVVQTDLNFQGGPVADFNIDVTRLINRTDFPKNDEPLIILYPDPIDVHVDVSAIVSATNNSNPLNFLYTFQDLETSTDVTCAVGFAYDYGRGQIYFNYRDVYNSSLACFCSLSFLTAPLCRQFHGNFTYGYLSKDGRGIPYTHCSFVPEEKLMPYHDPIFFVDCPCN